MLLMLLPLLVAGENPEGGRGALREAVSRGAGGSGATAGGLQRGGVAVRATSLGLAPAASLSALSAGRPVAARPAGLGCVGAT